VEEDEIGVQRSLGHQEYVECSRCGQPTLKSAASIVSGDALESQSEYEYLCPECQAALADGEQDLPLALP